MRLSQFNRLSSNMAVWNCRSNFFTHLDLTWRFASLISYFVKKIFKLIYTRIILIIFFLVELSLLRSNVSRVSVIFTLIVDFIKIRFNFTDIHLSISIRYELTSDKTFLRFSIINDSVMKSETDYFTDYIDYAFYSDSEWTCERSSGL